MANLPTTQQHRQIAGDFRYTRNTHGRTRDDELAYARAGAHLLVAKLMLRTALTEEEIAAAVIDAVGADLDT